MAVGNREAQTLVVEKMRLGRQFACDVLCHLAKADQDNMDSITGGRRVRGKDTTDQGANDLMAQTKGLGSNQIGQLLQAVDEQAGTLRIVDMDVAAGRVDRAGHTVGHRQRDLQILGIVAGHGKYTVGARNIRQFQQGRRCRIARQHDHPVQIAQRLDGMPPMHGIGLPSDGDHLAPIRLHLGRPISPSQRKTDPLSQSTDNDMATVPRIPPELHLVPKKEDNSAAHQKGD